MKKRRLAIIGAVVLATIGTLVLVGYVQSAHHEAVASDELVPVLVLKDGVKKGTAATDLRDKVKSIDVPRPARVSDAVTNLDDLKGLFTTVDLVAGEQVLRGRFASQGEATRGAAPPGLLQVTVLLDPERAVGGKVRAGDTVGVLLSFNPFENDAGKKTPNSTHLELHKVVVTDVQLQTQNPNADSTGKTTADGVAEARDGKYLVTLALDAPSVERVVFAAQHGFVWLSAEPKDASESGTEIVTRGNIYSSALP